MDEVLEFVSPSHSEIERLDRPQEYEVSTSMNVCHALNYQMIDGGQITTKRDNPKEHMIFRVVDAYISMLNKFNIFLPDNLYRKVELAGSQHRIENSPRAPWL